MRAEERSWSDRVRMWFIRPGSIAIFTVLASAFLFGGLGLAGGWTYGAFLSPIVEGRAPAHRGWIANVRDTDIGTGVIIGGTAFALLWAWITRPDRVFCRFRIRVSVLRSHFRILPTLLSLLCVGIGTGITYAIVAGGHSYLDDYGYVIAGLTGITSGLVLMVWIPTIRRICITAPSGELNGGRVSVRCPDCGYPLVGLTSTMCPECGGCRPIDQLDFSSHGCS